MIFKLQINIISMQNIDVPFIWASQYSKIAAIKLKLCKLDYYKIIEVLKKYVSK